jgi:lipopolysaccharide/colanic/teichoic acid biosynthesis glycosyltransferase
MISTSDRAIHAAAPASLNAIPASKRVLDILCCLLALPVLGAAALFVAALTSLTSPGPIFFRQERVGYRGRRFRLYKFRTMHVSAETNSHQNHFAELVRSNTPMQKLDARGDSRLIFGGWLLRASGLDELPQIINVLRGEMSLVGPRPCIPYEYDQYSHAQRERFDAAPGLTGLWQVSGKNRTTFEEMVQFDIEYARNQSLALDLKIMLLTLPALLIQISDVRKAKRSARATAPATFQNPPIHSAQTAR